MKKISHFFVVFFLLLFVFSFLGMFYFQSLLLFLIFVLLLSLPFLPAFFDLKESVIKERVYGAFLCFSGVARKRMVDEYRLIFGRTILSDESSCFDLQQIADEVLKEKANKFSSKENEQDEIRKKIRKLGDGEEKISREDLQNLYEAEKRIEKELRNAKRDFWKFHFYTRVLCLQTFPHIGDYLILN